jgi:ankyrin repeat protein
MKVKGDVNMQNENAGDDDENYIQGTKKAKKTEKDKGKRKLNYAAVMKLYKILLANDFEELIEFINEYGLGAVDRVGNNVFLLCVNSKTFIESVKKMIEQIEELNINVQNKYGVSALYIAVHEKNIELLELLLTNKNINIDIHDINGDTPLTTALLDAEYDEDIIIKLLDAGADLNKTDNFGYRLYEFVSESMEEVNKYVKEHNIKT